MKRKFLALIMILCLSLMMGISVSAAEDTGENDSKQQNTGLSDDPRDSILQLWMAYEDDAANRRYYQGGTCFLINDEYVLTNKHLYDLDNALTDEAGNTIKDENGNTLTVRDKIKTDFNLTELNDNDPHLKLFLSVNKDMRILATVHESVHSDDMDFAAVKLSEKIYDRIPISIGDSDKIATKDKVYAMGFPSDSASTKEYNTREDVSTVDGIISKITVTGNVDIIEHTAPLNFGNSGGPLLNEHNEVIGINTFMAGKKNYSIQINPIRRALDTFGIPYNSGSSTAEEQKEEEDPETEEVAADDNTMLISELQSEISKAKALDTEGYTEESVQMLNDSIGSAETVLQNTEATALQLQSAIDDLKASVTNLEEKKGLSPLVIGGIAAAVLLVIIMIVVIIVVSKGKKKKEEALRMQQNAGRGPVDVQRDIPGSAPSRQIHMADSNYGSTATQPEGTGETTLLNAGAGETTLLSGTAGAFLIRKKNGEKIVINSQNFKIGKERRKVDYCISDNTSVSRCHAVITKNGSDYYVTDQGSTNFTFVNDVQLRPNKETLLSDKCVLKLSDETFEFHLS